MKTIYKILSILAILVMPTMAFASTAKPCDVDDTIPATTRCDKYYYTKWVDECPKTYNGGVVDSCFCWLLEYHNFYNIPVAKWEHTRGRMKVKGLVAMVDRYAPPTNDNGNIIYKLPEYLYLYQLVGRHYEYLERFGIKDGLEFELLDSVRWDTATARVMELRRGWNGEYTQYCYLYEAYFENPVYVDSDFYIFGSNNSNHTSGLVSTDTVEYRIKPTEYIDIMDFSSYRLNEKYNCTENNYSQVIHDGIVNRCTPQGGWVALIEPTEPESGWVTPWPDSPWGYYLAIVDQWNLDAVPNDTAFGAVLGGGRWPDDTYDTIEAVPSPGYHFDSWNDGNTDNPRVIHLTSDTSFVAIFYSNESFNLLVSSSDEALGTVSGGGTFYGGTDNTIAATPNYGCKFQHWNDGVTDNPRIVHLTSDAAFVAIFAQKAHYNVQTATNNDDWGTVEGGGTYMEGDEATLTVTTAQFCIFDGWTDGSWDLPRTVTVTQDTLFTALFHYDSTWAAGIETAGTLEFTVSPNPTTGHLTITPAQPGSYDLTVFDMTGKTLLTRKNNSLATEIDFSALPAGKYILLLHDKKNHGTKTIIKK